MYSFYIPIISKFDDTIFSYKINITGRSFNEIKRKLFPIIFEQISNEIKIHIDYYKDVIKDHLSLRLYVFDQINNLVDNAIFIEDKSLESNYTNKVIYYKAI